MQPILKQFTLSEKQRQAAEARHNDVLVAAGAGTGKTRTLTARYLSLLTEGIPLRQIVAITFTRKAAREMRNRIRQAIGEYLQTIEPGTADYNRWQNHYNGLDAARIGTIHNLCGEILRTHPAEAGIDPRFDVLDEAQSSLLISLTIETTLAWTVNSPAMEPLLTRFREQDLQKLIEQLIKSRLDVADIMQAHPPANIYNHWQALLEANQKLEMKRLETETEWLSYFRTLVENPAVVINDKREIQRQVAEKAYKEAYATPLFSEKRQHLAQADAIDLRGGSIKSWNGNKEQAEAVKESLRGIRDLWRQAKILHLELNEQDQLWADIMPAIYQLAQFAAEWYQARKDEQDVLDFDDLEAKALHLLRCPAIQPHWQSQVQALLVDEFQDTNARQRHLIRLFCPEPGRLFIVGDAKQSIYRFRGADVSVFRQEQEDIINQGGTVIDLNTSYRAHSDLLTGMNDLLQPVLGQAGQDIPYWVAPFEPLTPGDRELRKGITAPFIEFHLALGSKKEALTHAAHVLAHRLNELVQTDEITIEYGDIAILCRTTNGFTFYEDAFDEAGIPYLTVAGKGFYERPEIRDLLNALQAIADPHDDLALAGLLRSSACGLTDSSLYQFRRDRQETLSLWQRLANGLTLPDPAEQTRLETAVTLITQLNRQAGRTGVADILKAFLDRTYYRAILRQTGQVRALRNVGKLTADAHASQMVSIDAFLEYVTNLRDSGSREGEARATSSGVVQIMTIHAAKGLEFPIVVLGDAAYSSGRSRNDLLKDPEFGILLPYKNDEDVRATMYDLGKLKADHQEAAEANRLLYVALTRAEQILIINGHGRYSEKSGKIGFSGWLGKLSEIINLIECDFRTYNPAGTKKHHVDNLFVEKTVVAATLYEPEYTTLEQAKPFTPKETEPFKLPDNLPLLQPVSGLSLIHDDKPNEDTPQRVWQVVPTAKRVRAPAWVIGSLVHEALAHWRFPDAEFPQWGIARAREYGITDAAQLDNAVNQTKQMLQRFQRSSLFKKMNTAERRLHELPFNYEAEEGIINGYIDALFLCEGEWTVVDFKTDYLRSEVEFENLINGKYGQQLRAYETAVSILMGIIPQLYLCFLNVGSDVVIRHID